MSEKQYVIGPNAVLTMDGLLVGGRPGRLKHVDDFRNFVISTSVAVAGVLEVLFVDPQGVPDLHGIAVSSGEPAWQNYGRHVRNLMKEDEKAWRDSGAAVLRWCVLAYVVAKIKRDDILSDDDFMPISYLMGAGGQSLVCSRDTWRRYEGYREWSSTGAAVVASLNGGGLEDPRPAPMSITAPWPELLGVDLGGESRALRNACSVATDILVGNQEVFLVVGPGGHRIRFDPKLLAPMMREFDACAVGREHVTLLSCDFQFPAGGVLVRGQRLRAPTNDSYALRLYPSTFQYANGLGGADL